MDALRDLCKCCQGHNICTPTFRCELCGKKECERDQECELCFEPSVGLNLNLHLNLNLNPDLNQMGLRWQDTVHANVSCTDLERIISDAPTLRAKSVMGYWRMTCVLTPLLTKKSLQRQNTRKRSGQLHKKPY